MIRLTDTHTPLLGQLAKITRLGVSLEANISNCSALGVFTRPGGCITTVTIGANAPCACCLSMSRPSGGETLPGFCLKEVGQDSTGDWYWYTLDQLLICGESVVDTQRTGRKFTE
jgi:hypothetical protein